jgi:hypothetical protein
VRRATKILFAFAFLAGASGDAMADPSVWRPDGVSDGVRVDRRDVPGSSFDELRLSTVSSLSLPRLCAAIYPTKLPAKLERRFKKQELLRETPAERWTYEQIAVPIVSDRDYVMHVKLEQSASSGHCSVLFETADDPSRPPVRGFVRIPIIRGHWDVFPVGEGKVSVQYCVFSEPGGGVPAFLTRGSQRSAAVDFMKIILARANALAPDPGAAAPPTAP